MECCDRPNVRACEYPSGFWVYFCLACGEKLNHWGHKQWLGKLELDRLRKTDGE